MVVRPGLQSKFPLDEQVEVEHRRGGPDRHYQEVTPDRQLAHKVLWGWATESADWESMLQWGPMDFSQTAQAGTMGFRRRH